MALHSWSICRLSNVHPDWRVSTCSVALVVGIEDTTEEKGDDNGRSCYFRCYLWVDGTTMGVGSNGSIDGHMDWTPVNKRLLRIGIVGSVVAAICCFTPIIVILFGSLGLSAAVAYLDFVLLPTLAVFLGITGYALWKRQQR